MTAVLLYKHTDNPLGLPEDYPAYTKPLVGGEKIDPPWIVMEDAALKGLIQSMYDQVALIYKARADAEKASEQSKLDALKRLFDDCEAIDDNWATATNAQKFELAQKTFRILRRQRRQILDQYRPE
jgi:hypothetical protein